MSTLFEETRIKGLRISNRFVRSATWEGMATEKGECTPRLVELMRELAKGGVGLIITSHAYVLQDGQAGPWQTGIYGDELIPGLRTMTEAVHEEGGRIVAQLAHAGFFSNADLTHTTPAAVSPLEGFGDSPRRVMTPADILALVEAFGQAAERAREAGFDAVQIHAAHGYLMCQFLSPFFNKRTDSYGGTLENRSRALAEVVRRVRSAVGTDFPVLLKMNSEDFLDGGLTLSESVQVADRLQAEGVDAIELSGGTFVSGKLNPSRTGIAGEEKEAYFQGAARIFKQTVRVPLILVGGIRSYPVARRIVEEGVADYISMSRPFIREPHLVRRWAGGDHRRAACLSDNQCFGPARAGQGITCVTEKREKEGNSK